VPFPTHLRQIEKAERDRIAELRAQTRGGRDYAWDYEGRAILIQRPDGDKLPSMLSAPHSRLAESDEPLTRGRKKSIRKSLDTSASQPLLRSKHDPDEPPAYQPLPSTQPKLVEKIQLAPGVSVREGASTIEARVAPDPEHPTHREFELLASTVTHRPRKLQATESRATTGRKSAPSTPVHRVGPTPAQAAPALKTPAPQPTPEPPREKGVYVPATLPKQGPQVWATLGSRSRLPRSRPPPPSKKLEEVLLAVSAPAQDATRADESSADDAKVPSPSPCELRRREMSCACAAADASTKTRVASLTRVRARCSPLVLSRTAPCAGCS